MAQVLFTENTAKLLGCSKPVNVPSCRPQRNRFLRPQHYESQHSSFSLFKPTPFRFLQFLLKAWRHRRFHLKWERIPVLRNCINLGTFIFDIGLSDAKCSLHISRMHSEGVSDRPNSRPRSPIPLRPKLQGRTDVSAY